MSGVDPYRDWLQLRTVAEHPSFYDLLELAPGSAPAKEAIVAAAKRQLEKLKPLEKSQHRESLRKLVDEIKSAAKCLCDPTMRTEYDRLLSQAVDAANEGKSALTESNPSAEKSALAVAIPSTIPLAIPISNALTSGPHDAVRPATRANDSAMSQGGGFRVVVNQRGRKRKRTWLFWSGHAAILVLFLLAVSFVRPDLRALVFGSPDARTPPQNAPSNDAGLSMKSTGNTPGKPTAQPTGEIGRPMDVGRASKPNVANSVDFPSAQSVPLLVDDPAMPAEPSRIVAVPNDSPIESPPLAVEIAKSFPMADDAVDFYARSIVTRLAENDIDSAVDFYSRLDSDSVSDPGLEMYDRLGLVANAYSKYRDWLASGAKTILGGTSLAVGSEEQTIAIVEATPQFMIVRDRGENLRFPLALLPTDIAWGVIAQTRTGDEAVPLVKIIATSVATWDQPLATDQLIAELAKFDSADPALGKTKAAALAWLQTDRVRLMTGPGFEVDATSEPFANALAQVAAAHPTTPITDDVIHDWIADAFRENEPLRRVALLEHAKRQASARMDVALAICLQDEINRANPQNAGVVLVELLGGFEGQPLDERQAKCLIVHILHAVQRSPQSLKPDQLETLFRVANDAAARLGLDIFTDAIERVRRPK